MSKEKIIDIQTGEETYRDFTKAELDELKQGEMERQKRLEIEKQRLAKRDSALAKLAALGLTEDEIAAL